MLSLLDLNEVSFAQKVFDFTLDENDWINLGNKPSVVLLYTDWCSYCLDIRHILEKVMEKYADKVDFYCINNDHSPALSAKLKIVSIPILLFVPQNEAPQKLRGFFPEHMIEFLIKDILIK